MPQNPSPFAALMRERRSRAALFGDEIALSDCAWSLLIAIADADEDGREISISGAIGMTGHPSTTGLRHLHLLIRSGLVERMDDEHDGRRVWLRLTGSARGRLEQHVSALFSLPVSPVAFCYDDLPDANSPFRAVVKLAVDHGLIGARMAAAMTGSP